VGRSEAGYESSRNPASLAASVVDSATYVEARRRGGALIYSTTPTPTPSRSTARIRRRMSSGRATALMPSSPVSTHSEQLQVADERMERERYDDTEGTR